MRAVAPILLISCLAFSACAIGTSQHQACTSTIAFMHILESKRKTILKILRQRRHEIRYASEQLPLQGVIPDIAKIS
jgi:hypothetical protein